MYFIKICLSVLPCNTSMSIELISDASCLSDGGKFAFHFQFCIHFVMHFNKILLILVDGGENGNTTKQVRFNLHSQTPISTTSIRPNFADSFSRNNLELSVEDEPDNQDFSPRLPQSLPSVLSKSLDLSVLDEPQLSRNLDVLSLDVPQINTVRNLQEEIIKLASRVHRAKNSVSFTCQVAVCYYLLPLLRIMHFRPLS